ncbi:MAG: type II secretion system major pseudopilin GspG [Planctomycetota bacterium]|jgi:general secretion pathway protein G
MKRTDSTRGFTLVEVMVVVVILGILASVVVVNISGHADRAKREAARTQIKNFQHALSLFRLDTDNYPTTSEGLKVLMEKAKDGKRNPEGYLATDSLPKDPWGNDYLYISPGRHSGGYDIISYGRDGRSGGEGPDADVNSWDLSGNAN